MSEYVPLTLEAARLLPPGTKLVRINDAGDLKAGTVVMLHSIHGYIGARVVLPDGRIRLYMRENFAVYKTHIQSRQDIEDLYG